MKAAVKPRQTEERRKKRTPASPQVKAGRALREIEAGQIRDLWKEEISALRAMKFTSLADGVMALVDKVLLRFGMQKDRAMRRFLLETLEEDPLVLSEIKSVLRFQKF